MVTGLIVVAVVGIVLPTTVLWLLRRQTLGKAPYSRTQKDTFGAPMGPADAWLTDHADLPALSRDSVRQAVFRGRAVGEQSLRPVAQQLAAAVLAGEVESNLSGQYRWTLRILGASGLIGAAVWCLVIGQVASQAVLIAIYGALALLMSFIGPWLQRSRLERAVRLNT